MKSKDLCHFVKTRFGTQGSENQKCCFLEQIKELAFLRKGALFLISTFSYDKTRVIHFV
jgi:hypothetical protein